jgi:DNA-binding transcriptional ArsR family regulator
MKPGNRQAPLTTEHRQGITSQEESLQAVAFLAKSLSDENRLRILLSLQNGKKSVSAIVEELQLSQPLISHHLKELRRALLVEVERRGPFIYYEMAHPGIMDILQAMDELAVALLTARKTF